jgi:uncharacterized protein YlxW (UPF0749 family)
MPDAESPQPPPLEGPEWPAESGQPSGRERLWRALLHPSRGQMVVAVLLAALGFAAVTQVRFTNVDNTYAGLREQDLIDVLNGLADGSQRAQSEITRLETTRDDLRSTTGARDAALAQAQLQADTYAIMAGLVPVTGPGITVTITEQKGAVPAESMVDMVQELRTAGAEAIQFNHKVRVVAQTSFEDAVGGIRVGGVLVTSPYVVDAIGDPGTLHGAIDFPKGPREQFEDKGAKVRVAERSSIDIKSVVKPKKAEYAQPGAAQ